MWPFKQKSNLLKGCVVAKVLAKTAEVPGFEKERFTGALGLVQQHSCPELGRPIAGRIWQVLQVWLGNGQGTSVERVAFK